MHPAVSQEDLEHILAHTRKVWETLRNESLFITGGTGFFGKWLLESLAFANARLNLGVQAVVLTRNPEAFAKAAPHLACDPTIRFVLGDVRTFTPESVRAQLGDAAPRRFSHCIHAATEVGGTLHADNPLATLDTIVQGTRAVLDFALASQTRRLLLTSSGAVYGRQEMPNCPEEYCGGPDCTHPGSAYGEGKRLAELLCAAYYRQHRLEPLIARCFAFVGPHLPLDGAYAIGNFIGDALRGGSITVKGDGTPLRSYLYAADLAIWLWTILVQGQPCRPYNVGSEEAVSIRDVAETVAECLHCGAPVIVEKNPDHAAPLSRYVPSTARARAELGLEARIGLRESIHRTAAWNRAIPCSTGTEPQNA